MSEHGVNLAGIRREIGLCDHVIAIVACNVFKQALEVVHVTVYGAAEFTICLILTLDVVKCLLTLQRVKTTGEDIAFATAVAVPELNRCFMIDCTSNIDRKRVERFNDVAR